MPDWTLNEFSELIHHSIQGGQIQRKPHAGQWLACPPHSTHQITCKHLPVADAAQLLKADSLMLDIPFSRYIAHGFANCECRCVLHRTPATLQSTSHKKHHCASNVCIVRRVPAPGTSDCNYVELSQHSSKLDAIVQGCTQS
jgi:hypothetical protein